MKRALLFLILLGAAGAGGWYWWSHRGIGATEYQTAPVIKGDLTQAVTATGTLNPVVNVQVGSQISGNIQKLFADYNTPVKAGQVVAQLDPSISQAVVNQMEGEVANASAALELARITAGRKKELVTQKAAPQAELDTATAALHQAEAIVRVRQANLEKAKVDLDHCTIYAPIDGVVISRSVDVGQTVAASLSAPVIFQIANDLAKMQIDSNVAEADVGNVELDQAVDFTVDAFPYRTFHGKVVQVRNAPLTVQNVVTYDTVISVSNDDLKLKPGMTANVSIVIAHREGVLRIPNAAMRFRPPEKPGASPSPAPAGGRGGGGGGRGGEGRRGPAGSPNRTVYVLPAGSNEPQPKQVKLGISDGIFTEVLEGLSEGDLVVLSAVNQQAAAAPPTTNPFSGGGGGPRFR